MFSTQNYIDDRAWYDDGIDTSYSTQWEYRNMTVERSSTSTRVTPTDNNSGACYSLANLGDNFELYFQLYISGIVQFGFVNSTHTKNFRVYDQDAESKKWYSYMIRVINGNVTFFKKVSNEYTQISPTETADIRNGMDDYHMLIWLANDSRVAHIKNIKAYFI